MFTNSVLLYMAYAIDAHMAIKIILWVVLGIDIANCILDVLIARMKKRLQSTAQNPKEEQSVCNKE